MAWEIGAVAPAIRLQDTDGRDVDFAAVHGGSPLVLFAMRAFG